MQVGKILTLVFGFLLLMSSIGLAKALEAPEIYFFYGQGCPHCAVVEKYFEDNGIYGKYPVIKKEIYSDHQNALLYTQMLDGLDIPQSRRGVPTLIVGDQVLIGDKPIIDYFDSLAVPAPAPATGSDQGARTLPDTPGSPPLDLTLAAVIGASVVDAINPCAFAVLIILMSTILMSGDSKKALKSGLSFSASIFISYFLMGLGLYSALQMGGLSGIFFKIIGWLAVIMGLANLKDYFWYGKGFLMEVPLSWRPRLKGLIGSVSGPVGAFLIGFLVSLFLLPCTSGPYIVILGMLARKAMQARAVSYLLLYNAIFVLPMVLITLAVYKGFNPAQAEEIRQKRLRVLHLIAGMIMIAMGFVILAGWI